MMKEPNTPLSDESATPSDLRPDIRRRGRRAVGAAITAGVLALVTVCNILFSLLADRFMWQLDETVTRYTSREGVSMYSPTEEFLTWMRDKVIPMVDKLNEERAAAGEEPHTINIKFCMERDKIYELDKLRMIQYSALALQKEFPEQVKVSYINIEQNPSAVQQYKATSSSRIYPHQIIFEFGTEYRVRSYDFFFLKSDESSTEHWAYNGEQKITSLLLALTRAISPVAGFITNHGESVENCSAFRTLVERSGYTVVDIDLSKDEIPDDCRLLICYDPKTDFLGLGNSAYAGTEEDESEIDKLDAFLDKCYSFMLFIDSDTPTLPVLEEYMEEWGITVARGKLPDGSEDSYTIRDQVQKLDKDGYIPIAEYVTTGTGGSLTSSMQEVSYPAKVVFPNATSIVMSDSFRTAYVEADESAGTPAYTYGSYYRNGVSRYFYDVFLGGPNSTAEVGGKQYEITTEQSRFRLMTLTLESRNRQETNYLSTNDPSYVAVFGSTEFASDTILNSASYGNADVLSTTLRTMGREVEPADLEFKAFKKYAVDTSAYRPDTGDMIATTVVMTLLPILVCIIAGVVVSVKRKYR